MAPTINMTTPVATAIAAFASTDKFIIFPAIIAAIPITPVFDFSVLYVASNFGALMDARCRGRKKRLKDWVLAPVVVPLPAAPFFIRPLFSLSIAELVFWAIVRGLRSPKDESQPPVRAKVGATWVPNRKSESNYESRTHSSRFRSNH